MRKSSVHRVLLFLGLLAVSAPLFAHHGNAQYTDKVVTLKGTVTDWRWTNPHVFLKMDVTGDDGKVDHWTCELVAPSNMVNFGFTADSFKPGDQVTVITSQIAKNGSLVARLGYNPKAGLIRGWQTTK